jgi:hypothetical protein
MITNITINRDDNVKKQIFRANDVAIIPNVRDYIKIGDDNHRVVERTFEYFPGTKKAEICECTITVEKLGIEVNL